MKAMVNIINQMKKGKNLLLIFILMVKTGNAQLPAYKYMMEDNSINFFTVCDSADAYFKNRFKGKGSGYKDYMRWKYMNKPKFYPSGNRMVDFYKPYAAYERIKKQQPQRLFETGGWQSLGPDTIGKITGHYAAGLGRVEYVEVNKANTAQLYIGSRSGGCWRTNDEGETWEQHTDFLPGSGVNAIAASPTNFDSVLINVRMATTGNSFGIYRSVDGGNTFTQTNFNPTTLGFGGLGSSFKVRVIKYHPRIPNLVFVGTNEGLFRSTDNLLTWIRTDPSPGWDVKDIEFHPTNNNIIYLYEDYYWGTNKNRIFKSTNAGVSFTALADLPNDDNSINISTATVCPSCVYIASIKGIWKSIDEGSSFVLVNETVFPYLPGGDSLFYGTPNDIDTTKFISGYFEYLRSTDGASSFNKCAWWYLGDAIHGGSSMEESFHMSQVYTHCDSRYVTCVNGVFYVCTDGYLCKSTDNGATWVRLSNSVGIRENYHVGNSQSNHYNSVCGSQDNGVSLKAQSGWSEIYGADGFETVYRQLNENWIMFTTQNGARYTSFNGGITSKEIESITPDGSPEGAWSSPLFFDPNHQSTVYSCDVSVRKSTDFGTSWDSLGTPLGFGGYPIEEAAVAENNTNIMVVASYENIELSTNGGLSFSSIRGTLPNSDISDVSFDPKSDSTIIVTYNYYDDDYKKIYISKDLGVTWQNITYNLYNMPIHTAVIDHSDSSFIYVGSEVGVYKMAMNGTNWVLYNNNLPNVAVRELEINYGSNTLKAATWGRGLWEYSLANRNSYPAILTTKVSSEVDLDSPKETVEQLVTSTIQYSGTLTSVYVKWSLNATTFNNTIPMWNSGGDTWITNTTLPTGPVSSDVYFKVFAVGNAGDTTETYKFMYTIYPYEDCYASGEVSSTNLYLDEVHVADMHNVNNVFGNYVYYHASPVLLYRDSVYTIQAIAHTSWSNNDYAAWIDYNGDLDFTADERILFAVDSYGSATNTFIVPHFVITFDTVMMRVRLSYWEDYPVPCGEFYGEVEDYPVYIMGEIASADEMGIGNVFIYPNPSSGLFNLVLDKPTYNTSVYVINAMGEQIINSPIQSTNTVLDLSKSSNGLYFVVVQNSTGQKTYKLIKQ